MAFRKLNPNVQSPFLSEGNTWSNAAPSGKTNKVALPTFSKENALATAARSSSSDMSALLQKNIASTSVHSSSSDISALIRSLELPADGETGVWSGATVQRPILKVTSTGPVFSGRTTGAALGNSSDDNSMSNVMVLRANKAKSKNASWKATSNLNHVLSKTSENSIALSSGKSANSLDDKPKAAFNLESLSSALPSNARVTTHHQSQSRNKFTHHASSAFTKRGGNDKMDYSAAARNNVSMSKRFPTKALGFPIYTDHPVSASDPSTLSKTPPLKLQDYSRKLQRLSEKGESGAAEEAEALLRDMLARYKTAKDSPRPDGSCYNHVIHAYAKTGRPERAEIVLCLMFDDYNEGGNKCAQPNVRVFTNLLHAWRKSKDPLAPENCEKLLHHMYLLSETKGMPQCKPDVYTVTVLLHCWAESGRKDAGARANEIFREMKQRFQDGEEGLRPDCICYSIVLNTFAQESKTEEAEQLLWEMVDDFLSGNDSAAPRTRNFNTIMAMYARSDKYDAPERAEGVLSRFRELCESRVIENSPDAYTYSLLLKAWATSDRPDGTDNALSAFYWMRDLYEDHGDRAACPDVVKYTTIIAAMVRNGDRTDAEALLNAMVQDNIAGNSHARPDYKLFEAVLSSYAVPADDALTDPGRAEAILRRMWTLQQSGINVRPRASTYKQVIVAYKKTNDAKRADELLWEMIDRKVPVDQKIFQTVLNAWHESQDHDKQYHIQKLRNAMGRRFRRR